MFVTIAVFDKAARLVKVPSLGRSVPHSWRMLGFSRLPDISSSNSAKLHVTFFFPSKNWCQGGHCWVTLSAALNMVRLTRIGWVFQKTGAGNEAISVAWGCRREGVASTDGWSQGGPEKILLFGNSWSIQNVIFIYIYIFMYMYIYIYL